MSKRQKEIWVEVPNWKKYQSRNDIKKMTFFRVENDIFMNPKFYPLSGSQKLVWFYVLTRCSQSMSGLARINIQLAARLLQSRINLVQSAIKALEELQLLTTVDVTDALYRQEKTRVEKSRLDKTRVEKTKEEKKSEKKKSRKADKPLLSFDDCQISELLKIITEQNFEKWHGRYGDKNWISEGIARALRYHNDNHKQGRTVEGWNRYLSNNLEKQIQWYPPKKKTKASDWAKAFEEADAEMEAGL